MDFEFAERPLIEGVQQAMYMPAQFVIKAREDLGELLLSNRGGEINIPGGQAGKGFRIAREQAVEECGAASQISDNEKRLFDSLGFVSRKKNVIQKKTDPMDQRSNGPDGIKHQKKDETFAGETGRGVFGGEERAVGGSPEEAEIVDHLVRVSLRYYHEKSPYGLSLLQFYQELFLLVEKMNQRFQAH
jgi:hypothetical protein